jgi:hypothetical protein
MRLLAGVNAWSCCWVWPRGGHWLSGTDRATPSDLVGGIIHRTLGIPNGWAGAAGFGADELDRLLAVAFVHMALGWHVSDDLFLVPDHGQQLLQIDHHRAMHVEFKVAEQMEEFIRHMREGNFLLPSVVPDETFKQPHWMGEGQA